MKIGSDGMIVEDNKTKKITSIAGLFIVAMIWGSTFTANKIVLNTLTPISLMAVRFTVAFLLMLVIFRSRYKGLKLIDLLGGMLCGASLFAAFILQTYGLLYTDAGKQAFLSGSYVIVVPFLTWFAFKKKPSLKAYFGTAVCFFGIALISLHSGFKIELGDSLTLISSIFFAAQIVIAGYFVKKEDPAVMTTVQFGVMGVMSFISALFIGDLTFVSVFKNIFTVSSLSLLYLGIVGTAIAYYLQILCQKHANPTTTSIVLSLEAVFGSIIAVLVLGDVFTLKMVMGAVAILASILITEL